MRPVALCVVLLVLLPGASSADDRALQDRIDAVHGFPDWQKRPLGRAELLACLRDLGAADVSVQRDALERLALARPTPQFRDAVFEAAKKVREQHDDRFSRAMLAYINCCWTEAETAAVLLQRAKRSGGLDFLRRMLQQGSPLQREQALAALGYSEQPEAAELIVASFRENPGIAARALAILGPPAAPAALVLLDDPDWTVRNKGAEVLAKIGTESEIRRLEELEKDPNGLVRKSAERAIRAIGARDEE